MVSGAARNWSGGWRHVLARLGNKTRRRMRLRYISGLTDPGDRTCAPPPMAARFAAGEYDRLHYLIAAGPWEMALLPAGEWKSVPPG